MMNEPELTRQEFESIRTLVFERLGINLTEQKTALVAARLGAVVRERGFATFRDYQAYLLADRSGEALSELADRIGTHHTYFNREPEHFRYFYRQVLPELAARYEHTRQYELRIWSAGCSTGEEPYLLQILLHEYFQYRYANWNTGVLATDVSAGVLEKAGAGVYPEDQMQGLPEEYRRKYFRPASDGRWAVNDFVKREIVFRRLNLTNAQFPFRRPFDVIFCRNVMIYFDRDTRESLVRRLTEWLEPGGYLFVGHSESLRDYGVRELEYVQPAIYRRGRGA